jgi:hypothetical protein
MNEKILTTIQVRGTEDSYLLLFKTNSKTSLVKVKDPRQETTTTTKTSSDNQKSIQDEDEDKDFGRHSSQSQSKKPATL